MSVRDVRGMYSQRRIELLGVGFGLSGLCPLASEEQCLTRVKCGM